VRGGSHALGESRGVVGRRPRRRGGRGGWSCKLAYLHCQLPESKVTVDSVVHSSMSSPPADTSPADGAPQRKRQRSCVGTAVVSFVDGSFFGGAIGGIIASASAIGGIMSGAESVGSAFMHVIRSGGRSALSLGSLIAGYNGGVCTLERLRRKRDVANPFVIGGIMGFVGSVSRIEVHDGQHKRRVLALNPRAALSGALSSAMLCSVFWWMQRREDTDTSRVPEPSAPTAPGSGRVPAMAPDASTRPAPLQSEDFDSTPAFAAPAGLSPGAFLLSSPEPEASDDLPAAIPGFVEVETQQRSGGEPPTRSDGGLEATPEQLQDPWARGK
jgi:hypothetical protein